MCVQVVETNINIFFYITFESFECFIERIIMESSVEAPLLSWVTSRCGILPLNFAVNYVYIRSSIIVLEN